MFMIFLKYLIELKFVSTEFLQLRKKKHQNSLKCIYNSITAHDCNQPTVTKNQYTYT